MGESIAKSNTHAITLPNKTDDDFLDKYKKYTNSICDYYTNVWIPELQKKKLKLTSASSLLLEEVQSRVSEMWDYFLNEK